MGWVGREWGAEVPLPGQFGALGRSMHSGRLIGAGQPVSSASDHARGRAHVCAHDVLLPIVPRWHTRLARLEPSTRRGVLGNSGMGAKPFLSEWTRGGGVTSEAQSRQVDWLKEDINKHQHLISLLSTLLDRLDLLCHVQTNTRTRWRGIERWRPCSRS